MQQPQVPRAPTPAEKIAIDAILQTAGVTIRPFLLTNNNPNANQNLILTEPAAKATAIFEKIGTEPSNWNIESLRRLLMDGFDVYLFPGYLQAHYGVLNHIKHLLYKLNNEAQAYVHDIEEDNELLQNYANLVNQNNPRYMYVLPNVTGEYVPTKAFAQAFHPRKTVTTAVSGLSLLTVLAGLFAV